MSVKEAVDTLPTELDVLYAKTLERISRSKPERARIGLMALLWVTHAKRPLLLLELQQLLATRYEVGSLSIGQFNPKAIPEQDVILAASCGLLVADASGGVRLMRELSSSCCSVRWLTIDCRRNRSRLPIPRQVIPLLIRCRNHCHGVNYTLLTSTQSQPRCCQLRDRGLGWPPRGAVSHPRPRVLCQ